MSKILDKLKEKVVAKKLFGIIAGPRLGGKSTLAGTLPGRTLLLQATVLESGSESATTLAKQLGNHLDVLSFSSLDELAGYLVELRTDTTFDNVVVDSLSAITDMKYDEPKIKTLVKVDNWAAFREIGDAATVVILALKGLTYPDKATKPKNTFLTCALAVKQDKNGTVVDVTLECKGNVAASNVTKYGEAVVIVLPPSSPEGHHRLLTKSVDVWPARVDGVLREANPGMIEPANLAKVLAMKGASA